MPLTPGTRIGEYEVLAMLGAGGMGEVYRARDTRLFRDVALKLLPSDKTREPVLLWRLRSEARIVAKLNHTNIAGLYDLQVHEDSPVLVMELVEGETLAQRIARGPLPIPEVLPIARQIAAALECAHEDAVIHRDLKPSNYKVTARHLVKVLDFGIATLITTQAEQPAVGDSSIQDKTHTNVVVGTIPYMSPEQARGEPLDTTCDIWAFGCVAFEMLTARQPFTRDTAAETVNAILREEPEWRLLPADMPSALPVLLRRCLRKDRHDRLRDIGDARIECADAEDELRHGDVPAKNTFETEVSDIRRRLLATTDRREIQRLVFEAEDLLSRAPYNPDLRMIRGALARAVEMGSVVRPEAPYIRDRFELSQPKSPVSYRSVPGWLVFVAVMLLLSLLAYMLR